MKSSQKVGWSVGVVTTISVLCAVVCAGLAVDCLVTASNFHDRHVDGHLHMLWVRVTDAQTGARLRPLIMPRERFTPDGPESTGSGKNLSWGMHWAADVEMGFMVWRPVRATKIMVYVPEFCAREITAGAVEEETFEFSLPKCAGEKCTHDECWYMHRYMSWLNEPAGHIRALERP
jgi:hypothetical protein